jgi:catechol 2,3-dioxygenase-like lactoylglutathione lyase family enzyme
MTIKSVAHVCIKTTDLKATSDFYCEALGLTKMFDFMRKGKLIGFYMKTGNDTFIEVFLADEVEKIGKQFLNHFCLETDEIEALHKKLSERGYEPRAIVMGADRSHQFWMKDPNGMELEFQEYTTRSSQRTGQTVEVNW